MSGRALMMRMGTWDSNCERIIIISTKAIVANAFIHFMESLKLTLRGIKSESGRTAESFSRGSARRLRAPNWIGENSHTLLAGLCVHCA